MKRIHYFILIAASLTMLSAGILIGRAAASPMAATGCFPDTNGHWAESFICWMAQNGIVGGFPDGTFQPDGVVTRAQAAVMIKRATEKGEIQVSVGPTGWIANAESSNHFVELTANSARLRSNEADTKFFTIGANAPATMFGRYTRLKGAKLCYSATSVAFLDSVTVMKVGNTNNGLGTPDSYAVDLTDRSDANCRTYIIVPPGTDPNQNVMKAGDHVALTLRVAFTDPSAIFYVSSTTFIFEPTSLESPQSVSGMAPPEDAQEPIMPLSEFPEWFGLDKGE